MAELRIPLTGVVEHNRALCADMVAAIARVIDRGALILGPEVDQLERELERELDVAHVVSLSSGTDALVLALHGLGIGPGDRVITSPLSFFASASAIVKLGADPVFVDIAPDTLVIDPRRVADAIDARTRAVVAVWLFGRAVDMSALALPVVEDAAQAIGAAPLRGVVGCLSFFPSKNLGALGDGGAIYTHDRALAERVRTLRIHGRSAPHLHHELGGNHRLDAVQAAVLRVKLPHLAAWTAARRRVAARYRAALTASGAPIVVPAAADHHVYNQFVIRAPRRDQLAVALAERGIETAVYYPRPLHQQPCWADRFRGLTLPHAERACAELLALPMSPALSDEVQDEVVQAIARFYRT